MTEKELHQRIIDVAGREIYGKMFSNCRELAVVFLREICTKFYRQQGLTICNIGDKLNKHHATISHYIKMFDINYEYSKTFRNLADKILK